MSLYVAWTYVWCLLQNGRYACETTDYLARRDIRAHVQLLFNTAHYVPALAFTSRVREQLILSGADASNRSLVSYMITEYQFARCVVLRNYLEDAVAELSRSWYLYSYTQLNLKLLRRMNIIGQQLKSCQIDTIND